MAQTVMNFVVGVSQTHKSIRFVLTFQKVHRFLKNDPHFDNLIIWNWIVVIIAATFYNSAFVYFTNYLGLPMYFIYVSVILSAFDFNIVYAYRLMTCLTHKLEVWNIKVLSSGETNCDIFSKNMFQAYLDILECYDLVEACFQHYFFFVFQILFYIGEVFIHYLDLMSIAGMAIFSTVIWLMKNLAWQIMLSQQCEKFYSTVQSAQDNCMFVLKSNCTESVQRLCKNVRRLHRSRFSKLRVCALFRADAALQLSLMALLTDYIVVVLQFAFL
ncbi:hypothetical protein B5X24_HaOG200857 [Helicoverpa armigera]|uniref:Gustatory receptor n=1 Tax=Helicoverpa armigera TaxID=29058 RepID=A0A2W1BNU1_HELAM|nr:hypothetical protein B5X24_HaOG200857 [Helicoverpa armigera]